MRLLPAVDAAVRRLSHIAFVSGGALLLVLGLVGFLDVLSTNLLLRPIPGAVEISGTLLAVIVFLGLAEAQARESNIVIDIFTQRMSASMKRICEIASLLFGAVLMALIAWRTAVLMAGAWQYSEIALGALPFPMAPGKTLAFVGAVIATAEFARQLLHRIVIKHGEGGIGDG